MGSRSYSFDINMLLADGAAAVTASGQGTVGGAAKMLDLGGAPSRSDLGIVGGYARIDAMLVLDVSALNVANANNLYTVNVIGSNTAGTLAGGQILASFPLGNTAAMTEGAATSTPGRYEIPFTTEQADINYEYVGLYITAAGTSPSITAHAFVAVLPGE